MQQTVEAVVQDSAILVLLNLPNSNLWANAYARKYDIFQIVKSFIQRTLDIVGDRQGVSTSIIQFLYMKATQSNSYRQTP
jgi:hypothetical protein